MICTTLQNRSLNEIYEILESSRPVVEMAEIRLDKCPLGIDDIEELFSSSDTPLIATCRVAGDGASTWPEAEEKLSAAIKAGAAYADLEIEAPKEMGKRLRRLCSEYGTQMIRSCHFYESTPAIEVLQGCAGKCRRFGGDIVKIVAMAHSEEDAERVLSLYDVNMPFRLIAFAMGDEGRKSRLRCLKFGAPFTYAALSESEAAAPGQWVYSKMLAAAFGNKKPLWSEEVLSMPSSKSFAQRAVIAAALADGTSILEGYSPCGDTDAAIGVARSLGATVTVEGSTLTITGAGGNVADNASFFTGESGLLTRLMIPLSAALYRHPVTIEGTGTLIGRPLKGAAGILAPFGTVLKPLEAQGKNPDGTIPDPKVPLTVNGPLLAGKADISGKDGSQLVSGLLMALPLLDEDTVIHVHDPRSIPYMFITMDVLRRFGIKIASEMEGDEDFMETQDWSLCTGITFKIKGRQKYSPASFQIEGDWSAAANFLVAGALFGRVRLSSLDTTSLQADISIMDILMDAGASISQLNAEGGEEDHKGIITVQRAPLRAFESDLNNCPDLFPIVSVLAAYCHGKNRLKGFKRLEGKESNRGEAILDMLTRMGVEAWAEDDELIVVGESLECRFLSGNLLKGGRFTTSHDHRMAMALSVASLATDTPVEMDDTDCLAKSFPGFADTFRKAL
ncbi:MAG: type I 3-dehydroquinate dehydratase [Bacteroidales bacterium]|nr:type I 3-dehydroquinate dehydratase [Bacteroidales bacterium]